MSAKAKTMDETSLSVRQPAGDQTAATVPGPGRATTDRDGAHALGLSERRRNAALASLERNRDALKLLSKA